MIAAALAAEAGSGTQGAEGPSAVPAYVHRFMNYARTSAEGRALIRDSSASSSVGPPGVLAAQGGGPASAKAWLELPPGLPAAQAAPSLGPQAGQDPPFQRSPALAGQDDLAPPPKQWWDAPAPPPPKAQGGAPAPPPPKAQGVS